MTISRQSVTQMNVNRSAQSACVLKGLPNIKGYSYHSREIHDAPCTLKIMNNFAIRNDEILQLNDELPDIDNIMWEHGAPEPFF